LKWWLNAATIRSAPANLPTIAAEKLANACGIMPASVPLATSKVAPHDAHTPAMLQAERFGYLPRMFE